MTDAPKRIWAWGLDGNVGHATQEERIGKIGDSPEYHLVRAGQPCTDLEFMEKLFLLENKPFNIGVDGQRMDRVTHWLAGDFAAAMRGLG